MSTRNISVSASQLVSPDRVIDVMRRLLRQEVKVAKRFTLEQIAAESGVHIRILRCWMSDDEDANREPKLSAAFSVAVVLGKRAVNMLLAVIGYVGTPLEDEEPAGPALAAARAMESLSRFAVCAADNRIDHIEEPTAEASVDDVIEILTPFSSRAGAA